MYFLIWGAELVTFPSSKTAKPHFEATATVLAEEYFHGFIGPAALTEDLVANIVLSDKVTQKLLVDPGTIHHLYTQPLSVFWSLTHMDE